MATKGALAPRAQVVDRRAAASSLPVPLSPVISTAARLGATCWISAKHFLHLGRATHHLAEHAMITQFALQALGVLGQPLCAAARSISSRSACDCTGFSRNQKAPRS